uniref:Uncharacterized protein n=1 Tax=Arundo donax TaxID=35708 RepID=A0A0A8Z2I6_ARUDO
MYRSWRCTIRKKPPTLRHIYTTCRIHLTPSPLKLMVDPQH